MLLSTGTSIAAPSSAFPARRRGGTSEDRTRACERADRSSPSSSLSAFRQAHCLELLLRHYHHHHCSHCRHCYSRHWPCIGGGRARNSGGERQSYSAILSSFLFSLITCLPGRHCTAAVFVVVAERERVFERACNGGGGGGHQLPILSESVSQSVLISQCSQ